MPGRKKGDEKEEVDNTSKQEVKKEEVDNKWTILQNRK